MTNIITSLTKELAVEEKQVSAAVQLLDEGSTVPFIARYRKEATGALDDNQLRLLEERLIYLRELEERKDVILKSITEQDKLTPELEASIDRQVSQQVRCFVRRSATARGRLSSGNYPYSRPSSMVDFFR